MTKKNVATYSFGTGELIHIYINEHPVHVYTVQHAPLHNADLKLI